MYSVARQLSFLYRYLSLLLLASVFLPLLHWFIFFYFSPFSRQFVAGENLRVAGDIAGRRRFLTTLVLYSKRPIVAMIRGKVLRKFRYDPLVVIQSRKIPKQHVAVNEKYKLAPQEHQDNGYQLQDNASDRFLYSKINKQSGGP